MYSKNIKFWLLAPRVLLMLAVVLSCAGTCFSQVNPDSQEYYEKPRIWDRLAPGGNFSLQFGTVTYIDVSPSLGYRVTDRFTVGPGITYRYLKYRGYPGSSIYGGRFFARHILAQQFFVQAEYESLSVQFPTNDPNEPLTREWVPGLFVGGGLYQPVGQRAGIMIAALYNLSYDALRSPYNSPWVFNVGFTF